MKKCKEIYSEAGSPIKIVYSPVVDEKGVITLVESGKVNTDEEIQSYAESCDLSIIINRYINGDINALNQRQGMYGDFTNLPKTYAEFLQKQIDAQNTFDKLPNDVKKKFDNDVNQFLASAGSEDWLDKLGLVEKKIEDEVKEASEE